jgi:8-oxo-dGTP pyrophosphatase MutT (NUDIX family)
MATPDFIIELREKVGHAPLWLSGITAVVLRDGEAGAEVLLVRRTDNGHWTPVTGIIDPGEQPAVAAERETLEEANVVAVAEALTWVRVTDPLVYANGDHAQFLDIVFLCRWVSGEPFPSDGENTDAAWFALDALPTMTADMSARIASAVGFTGAARFER